MLMSNDVLTEEDANLNPFEELERELKTSRIIGSLLKFTKQCEWTAGKDVVDLTGKQLIVYMSGLHDGYIFWEDNHPTKYDIGLIAMMHPKYGAARYRIKDRKELGDHDESLWPKLGSDPQDPWQRTFWVVMADPETEELYTYTPQSKGGRGAIIELLAAWNQHNKLHGAGEQPIVELNGSSYKHSIKSRGDIQIPVLKVVGFTSELPQSLIDAIPQAPASTPQAVAAAPQKAIAAPGNGGTATKPASTSQVRQASKPVAKASPPAKGGKVHGKGARF
jgi:hypothetical protein